MILLPRSKMQMPVRVHSSPLMDSETAEYKTIALWHDILGLLPERIPYDIIALRHVPSIK